jgi:hypothetical protein
MTVPSTDVTPDGEVIAAAPITLFGTDNPVAVVDRASTIATALADVIRTRSLFKRIGQSDHVFVEGWTLLGSMLGVFAEVEWSRPLEDKDGWESRAVARTLAGRTVGAAESMCSRAESKWRNSDDYAIRSMAQTRAVSKALRLPLGFIMELAGYSATPADEIADDQSGRGTTGRARSASATQTPPDPASYTNRGQVQTAIADAAKRTGFTFAMIEAKAKELGIARGDASMEQLLALLAAIEPAPSMGLTEDEFAVVEATVAAGGAESPAEAPKAEEMAADAAIAAGAALVGKS